MFSACHEYKKTNGKDSNVVFVSVTQEVNTSTSAGRMNLNIVISFAQYEREIIGERIRDKIAAAKKKGMNTGGFPPMEYESDPATKKYHIIPEEAEVVRKIFETYLRLGSARDTAEEMNQAGYCKRIRVSKRSGIKYGGTRFTPGYIYGMLNNPVYAGYVRHFDKVYPGEYEAIITQGIWDRTQELLKLNSPPECRYPASDRINPLKGIVRCGYCGCALKRSYTKRDKTKCYRYLICDADSKRVKHTCPLRRVPLNDLEEIVVEDIKIMLSKPDVFFRVMSEAKELDPNGANLTSEQVRKAFGDLGSVWKVMFPAERFKFIQTIIKKITVFRDQVKIEYKKGPLRVRQGVINAAAHSSAARERQPRSQHPRLYHAGQELVVPAQGHRWGEAQMESPHASAAEARSGISAPR